MPSGAGGQNGIVFREEALEERSPASPELVPRHRRECFFCDAGLKSIEASLKGCRADAAISSEAFAVAAKFL